MNKRIRSIFRSMKYRCYNPNSKDYRWYGAKGIKICDEWLNNPNLFEEWALNNGYTDTLTIDRIEENKDYCPENCRWISRINNAKYKSTTSLIEVDGEIHTGKEWAYILNLSPNLINRYIKKYGLENTVEFIKRYRAESSLQRFNMTQSYYELYMNTVNV